MGGVCGNNQKNKKDKSKQKENVNNNNNINSNNGIGVSNNNINNQNAISSNSNNINNRSNLVVLSHRNRNTISNNGTERRIRETNIEELSRPYRSNLYTSGINRDINPSSGNNNENVNQRTSNVANLHPIDVLTNRQIIDSNNNANISINDEFSIRRTNQTELNNNNINLYPGRNVIPITLRNYREDEEQQFQFCSMCSVSFESLPDLQRHFSVCTGLRNNQMMHHSINEILHLVQSLNRQLQFDNPLTLLSLLKEVPEEITDYIDWVYYKTEDGSVVWKQLGKVHLSKEEMEKISEKSAISIKSEKYFKKRIWMLKYINKNIYDNTGPNTTLVVSRENIFEESFYQFMTTHELDLKKAMQIFFVDEVAQDVGGVYREWYSSLFEKIFAPEHGFFFQVDNRCIGRNSCYIPTYNPKIHIENYLEYYEFIGKVLGKAIFDKITIKSNFNIILIKLLLQHNIVLEDIKYLDSEYYMSLRSILDNPITGNYEFTMTWNIRRENDIIEEIELVPNGRNIILTEDNKLEFVYKVVNLISYVSIKEKVDSLLKGFYSLIPLEIINIYTPEEFDFLLSGQSEIDLVDWKNNTIYKGFYNENHHTVQMFWEVLQELPSEKLLQFYRFCTGSSRVPIDGFNSLQGTRNKYLKFCVESPAVKNQQEKGRLIEAKTCFNRILLPDYNSKEELMKVISTIIDNDTNFFGKQ